MAAKLSFKKGTLARKVRSRIAEEFKAEGDDTESAFAKATAITQRVKTPAARKRLGKHGLTKKKGS